MIPGTINLNTQYHCCAYIKRVAPGNLAYQVHITLYVRALCNIQYVPGKSPHVFEHITLFPRMVEGEGMYVLICHSLLAFVVIRPLTTHSFRDGASFVLLIETPLLLRRSLRLFHILRRNVLLIVCSSCFVCGHFLSPGDRGVLTFFGLPQTDTSGVLLLVVIFGADKCRLSDFGCAHVQVSLVLWAA